MVVLVNGDDELLVQVADQQAGVQPCREGQPFQPEPDATATFLNNAEEVMTQYPGVVELD